MAVSKSISFRLPPFEPDERQRQAIEHVSGPMLVVAGAGTGKTTVLVKRIVSLVRDGHARPDEILAVTYTDAAAREMLGRVKAELGGADLRGMRVETFHAYCNHLLSRCNRSFRVLEPTDIWIYLRRRIRDLKLDHFTRAANVSQFLSDLLDFMSRCQDELVGPEKYSDYVRRIECGELAIPRVASSKKTAELTAEDCVGRCREIAHVFSTVERMLLEENMGTFGHQITRAFELLHADEAVVAEERKRARFILVDEFQDANFAQVKILQKLGGDERSLFAVGDPDQSIYKFRGASSEAFALFQRHFPGNKLVVLGKNRRSTTPILQCAFALIAKNPDVQLPISGGGDPYRRSPLVSTRDEEAEAAGRQLPTTPVEIAIQGAKDVESFDLVETIVRKKKALRCDWSDFAVLYRLHTHREQLVDELLARGIPFSIENMDVMDTSPVRDLLACIGAVVSENDTASLFRVAALPQFNVDPEKLRAAIRAIPRDTPTAGIAESLAGIDGGAAVLESVRRVNAEVTRTQATGRAAFELVAKGFELDRNSAPLSAVIEFAAAWEKKPITRSGTLAEFLEYMEYFREAKGSIPLPSREKNAVHLMTAHAAKGLEFDHVFIIRANTNSFPWSYKEPLVAFPRDLRDPDSLAQDDDKTLHGQEERRLFYVAMTRARDTLTTYANPSKSKADPVPSGYLRDLTSNRALKPWLKQRTTIGFQPDIFASAATMPRVSEWLQRPAAVDLSKRLSASSVQSYQTCPLRFKLEREWRFPHEVHAAMQYGSAMHLVLKSYYDSVRYQRPMTDEAVIALFHEQLAIANIQDRYQHDLYEQQGVGQLQEFLERNRREGAPEVLHTEEVFEIKVGDCTVIGRIDRVDRTPDGVAITDYKTGKPQTQEDADDSLQLSIYAMAAHEKWGYNAERLAFYNLGENSSIFTQRDPLELEKARQQIKEVAENIAAGKFEPQVKFHCHWCPYRNLCPAKEKPWADSSDKKPRN